MKDVLIPALICSLLWQSCLSIPPPNHNSSPEQIVNDKIDGIASWINSWRDAYERSDRPYITLTYAQSLDGKIASTSSDEGSILSSNLPISGTESLLMTHALRSMHDAILIGGTTALIDNPRLTNRLWRGDNQPRPIILDPNLKCIRELGDNRKVENPIVCCSREALEQFVGGPSDSDLTLVACKLDEDGRIDLPCALYRLSALYDIQSIMVEGGSRILSAFAAQGLVDCLCVTISPKLIGNTNGLPSIRSISELPWVDMSGMGSSRFVPLGADCILLAQWPHQDQPEVHTPE